MNVLKIHQWVPKEKDGFEGDVSGFIFNYTVCLFGQGMLFLSGKIQGNVSEFFTLMSVATIIRSKTNFRKGNRLRDVND